ncbi:D-sedoheptulose 7-phosphate isomerase [Bdellovibrionota bacterium FG-2]
MSTTQANLNPTQYLAQTFEETLAAQRQFFESHSENLIKGAKAMGDAIAKGGKILIFGNGGSAADAQHMAAELVGRMLIERLPLPALALSTDTSNLTAIGNDYGFEHVFTKQLQALAKKGDVVVAISTSGNSPNILSAVREARKMGCFVIAMTGGGGGKLKHECDLSLNVELGKNSCRIQEAHAFAIHCLVDILDRYFLPGAK